MSVLVIRQPIECSEEELSATQRINDHVVRKAGVDTRPENDQPDEALKVDFDLTVLCAELDQFNGQLRTHAWESVVRKTNGECDE